MRSNIEEFQHRRKHLENLSYADEKARLSSFYSWMQSVSEIKLLTERLAKAVDVMSFVPSRRGSLSGPKAGTPEEIVAIGLHLLEKTTTQTLHTTSCSLGIRGGSSGQSYTDVCMEKYVAPLLDWIQDELEKPKNGDSLDIISPHALHCSSDVLSLALQDAESLLHRNGATSALDRIHTAIQAHLLAICEAEGIACAKDSNLTGLFKLLREQHPAFANASPHSEDVLKLQRAVAVILDVFNPLRNRASVAHANPNLLPHDEAMLAINVGKSILKYLDAKIKNYRPANLSS